MKKRTLLTTGLLIPLCSQANTGENVYVVKNGETISKIAELMRFKYKGWSFKRRLESLISLNPHIKNHNNIFPGNKLILPKNENYSIEIKKERKKIIIEKKKDDSNFYVVKKGETLSHIAKKFIGSPIFDKSIGSLYLILKYNNQIKSPNLISVGDKIFIPSKEEVRLYRFMKKGTSNSSLKKEKAKIENTNNELIEEKDNLGKKKSDGMSYQSVDEKDINFLHKDEKLTFHTKMIR